MEIGDFVKKKIQEDGEEVEVLQVTDKVDIDGVPCIKLKGRLASYSEKYYEVVETPTIKDSGERRVFETGSVRDIQAGKGRCDLEPIEVIGDYMKDIILQEIGEFTQKGAIFYLENALHNFRTKRYENDADMILEVSIHFEQGALKYGENNWQKGIPTHCYIDSAVRHYLKWLRGDKDEPHDRAFVWNLLCCIWTCEHKPELNDYGKGEKNEENTNAF